MSTSSLPHNHNSDIFKTLDEMPGCDEFLTVSDIFKQLSDCSRIRIFWILCHCEECVINIASLVNMSTPAVSHHLKQLKDNGLIVSRREGKEVYYKAADTKQVKLLHITIEKLVTFSCPFLCPTDK